jgi:hypothetical protein
VMGLLSFLQSSVCPYTHGSMIRSILLPLPGSCEGIVVILAKFNPSLYSWFHDQEYSPPLPGSCDGIAVILTKFNPSLYSWFHDQEYSPPPFREL